MIILVSFNLIFFFFFFNTFYKYKFILGPRKHQLDYNLTTYYIKIFMIGGIGANVSLIKLNSSGSSAQAIQIHPNISYVGTADYRFNNADTNASTTTF